MRHVLWGGVMRRWYDVVRYGEEVEWCGVV